MNVGDEEEGVRDVRSHPTGGCTATSRCRAEIEARSGQAQIQRRFAFYGVVPVASGHSRMGTGENSHPASSAPVPPSWLSAWPDALALAGGLALAWWLRWKVRDLVWSLWLSSLLVGYAMIVWMIFSPALVLERAAAADGASPLDRTTLGGAYLFGGLFLLAFFTFHFGMFHFVHSAFLNVFFPVLEGRARGFPSAALYLQVVRAYWPFVLVAAVAERQAFRMPSARASGGGPNVTKTLALGGGMMEPYKNVVRMHALIFFFAFAHFVRLENFIVYAIVYAVYFFPWRLVKRTSVPPSP